MSNYSTNHEVKTLGISDSWMKSRIKNLKKKLELYIYFKTIVNFQNAVAWLEFRLGDLKHEIYKNISILKWI